jgi:hypothetical protein
MNIKATALCVAAAAFAFTPKPAVAGDKEAAIVGGLIGGLIIGAAIADAADSDTHVTFASHRYADRCDDGYWRTVDVRTWVPGYWVTERRHGRTHRYYVEGHYEIRTKRVWVAYDRYNRYDRRDRYDRYDRHDRYGRDYRR